MNKLAHIISELSAADLMLLKKDLDAGNLHALIAKRFAELRKKHTCPTCGRDLDAGEIRFTIEFGPADLRQKASFDEYDCLQYFLEHTVPRSTS